MSTLKIFKNIPNESMKFPTRIFAQYNIVSKVKLFSFRSVLDLDDFVVVSFEGAELAAKLFAAEASA